MPAPTAADCYSPLRQSAQALLEHCQQLVSGSNAIWLPHLGWLATPLSRDWIEREPTLRAVQQISPIDQLGILMMPDHWLYHWHRDQSRLACINLLISNTSMHCLELRYEPRRFYLFNNQVPHTVINLDVNRYLFSLEFVEPVPYVEQKRRLAEAGMLEADIAMI